MATSLLASWFNEQYSAIGTSIGTTTAISTGVTARTVAQGSKATVTDINGLVNSIVGLRSNTYLRHADGWTNNTPATVTSGTSIQESNLKTKIDNLIDEFEKMCGNKVSWNAYTNTAYRYGFGRSSTSYGNGTSYSYTSGFGRSTGNGKASGNGHGSWDCASNRSNNFHTCTNYFSESTSSNSTSSNSTSRTSYGNNTSYSYTSNSTTTCSNLTGFTHSRTVNYNFAVKSGGGTVTNSNTT